LQLLQLDVKLAILHGPEALLRLDRVRGVVVQVGRVTLDADLDVAGRDGDGQDLGADAGGHGDVAVQLLVVERKGSERKISRQ
jgi:hypothetical protein